ncbi:MAG: DUF1549 and DUF1553 domain-containing protein [Planctomycetaceae bacterium]
MTRHPAPRSRIPSAALAVCALAAIALHAVNAGETPAENPAVVAVEVFEGLPEQRSWDFELPAAVERFELPAFGLVSVPRKYSAQGTPADRAAPFALSAVAQVALPAGEMRLVLRSKNAARLLVDGKVVVETVFLNANASGHEHVPQPAGNPIGPLAILPTGHQEQSAVVNFDGRPHEFRLLAIVGGKQLRPELGEVCVAVDDGSATPRLLGPGEMLPCTDLGWQNYVQSCRERQRVDDIAARRAAAERDAGFWKERHKIARLAVADRPGPTAPDVQRADATHNAIDRFINARLEAEGIAPGKLCDDLTFLRRITLDTVGVVPTLDEISRFLADGPAERRSRAIERLLVDPRWADHWVGYWQDVLAENPGILKPTLNNTGPFRWWIHESFLDNKPFDRFATELIGMESGRWSGGPAGFAVATQNDSPPASKAHIIAKAFLGVELQCARCHDAPFHPFRQHDLFSLAAMLAREPQAVPATSTVIAAERSRRPLVQVTLEPGVPVDPAWPFAELASAELPAGLVVNADDSRERLAAIITAPGNARFAQVLVNRLWQRDLGVGLVEPVDDWHNSRPSHPELLDYLAREFVLHAYDVRHVARLIFQSHTYQRAIAQAPQHPENAPERRLFASPARRRLSAEQLVDTLFLVAGKEFHSEELTMDPEARRPVSEMQNLGTPRRAWEFTSLSNERDRPALSLPVAQSVVDLLTAFGWRESRQNPQTVREDLATALQPMVLANGVVGGRIVTLSDDSSLTDLALEDQPVERLVETLFLRVLTRPPTDDERRTFANLLREGYAERQIAAEKTAATRRSATATGVSWSNHLSPEATRIKLELERVAREGDPPTGRLSSEWRERMEDVVWALVNSPEFVFVP